MTPTQVIFSVEKLLHSCPNKATTKQACFELLVYVFIYVSQYESVILNSDTHRTVPTSPTSYMALFTIQSIFFNEEPHTRRQTTFTGLDDFSFGDI